MKLYIDYNGKNTITTLYTPKKSEYIISFPRKSLKDSYKYIINITKGNNIKKDHISSLCLLEYIHKEGFSNIETMIINSSHEEHMR